MRLIHLLLLILPLSTLAQDQYEATFSKGLETVRVSVCYQRSAPRRLIHSEYASLVTESFRVGQTELKPAAGSRATRLPRSNGKTCAKWRLNLAAATARNDSRAAIRLGEDMVMDTSLWFWRGPTRNDIQLRVHLPKDMNISTPWVPVKKRGNTVTFEFSPNGASLVSRTAVGRFDSAELMLDQVNARLSILGSTDEAVQASLTRWISQATNSVAGVYGRFPQPSPQILVVPIGARQEPVPWAHVMRGGNPAAEFFVDETRSLQELNGDWTATHEFSHMLLPQVSHSDRWLSEGLASYYQYVLMARSGTLSATQAWQGLVDGFGRGQADDDGGTLADATDAGWKYTMRVYWSGAAMMLLADTRLRSASGGTQSLDTALDSLQHCCLESRDSWTGESLFMQLDQLTGRKVFSSLYREHVFSTSFPDVSETLQALGIETGTGAVQILEDAPKTDIRAAIMGRYID